VKNYELHKRDHPAEFKQAKKDNCPPLQQWETNEDRITQINSTKADKAAEA
jgi:hypothetical protein